MFQQVFNSSSMLLHNKVRGGKKSTEPLAAKVGFQEDLFLFLQHTLK